MVNKKSFGVIENDIRVLKLAQSGLIERQRLFGGTGNCIVTGEMSVAAVKT